MSQENVEAMRGVRYRITFPTKEPPVAAAWTSACSFASRPSTT